MSVEHTSQFLRSFLNRLKQEFENAFEMLNISWQWTSCVRRQDALWSGPSYGATRRPSEASEGTYALSLLRDAIENIVSEAMSFLPERLA
jgi:hypothetical protein